MSNRSSILLNAEVLSLVAALFLSAGAARADGVRLPVINGCNTLNCSALQLQSRVNAFAAPGDAAVNPWVQTFLGTASRCLRFQAVAPAGYILTIISPDNRVYTSKTGPLVVIQNAAATNKNGWYTAALYSPMASKQATSSNFSIFAGSYPIGNVNCSPATIARSVTLSDEERARNAKIAREGIVD
jgi:hypothetical protein